MYRRSFLRSAAVLGVGDLSGLGETGAENFQRPSARSSPTIATDFEGGSLGKAVWVTDAYVRCLLVGEVDQNGDNRQVSWFYFRIDGAPDSELTIDFTDLKGEYNFRPGNYAITPDTPPVFSYDARRWTHAAKENWSAAGSGVRLRIKPVRTPLWLAHVAPYTNRDLARLLDSVKAERGVECEVIGKSVQGRDLPLLTITDPAGSRKQRKVVWLMFRQHSWEAGSSWVGEGAVRFLVSSDPIAARIRKDIIFKILPMQDPDGVFRGGVRFNAYGYDLNRNWDVVDPVKMPEITAARSAIFKWADQGGRIDFFLSLHNDQTNEYLGGPPGGEFSSLGQKVLEELTRTTTFEPTRPYVVDPDKATPPRSGRMDVIEGLNYKHSIPAFLMEQKIVYVNKLGHWPTVEDRLEFGKGLVKAIWTSLMA